MCVHWNFLSFYVVVPLANIIKLISLTVSLGCVLNSYIISFCIGNSSKTDSSRLASYCLPPHLVFRACELRMIFTLFNA